MAKGQQRGNREPKKPKKPKVKAVAAEPQGVVARFKESQNRARDRAR